jgi:signal transduction histidine kinase
VPTRRPRPTSTGPGEKRLLNLLTSIVNALPVVVYAFDPNGTILLAEGNALGEMGSQPGAPVGDSVVEVFAGESETIVHLERALAGERHEAKLRLARNGRSYHVWYVPTFSSDGSVAMVTGLSLDVTEMDAAQAELSQATRWLEQMLERLPVAIFRVNSAGVLTMLRGSFLPEWTLQQVGRRVADAFSQFPQLVEALDAGLAGKDQAFSFSGTDRSFEFFATGMVDEFGERGVLGVCIEVTEQRRAAKALAETEAKSKFLANVSHELRTPLNSILGYAELLEVSQGTSPDDTQRRFLTNIRKSGQHLAQLVDQLLGLSRLEAMGPNLHPAPVNLEDVVDEVIERMLPLALTRGVTLRSGRHVPQVFEVDRLALVQILLNLVSNALKFTRTGGQVRISYHVRPDSILILVQDTGIGIDPAHQESIFEEFFQIPCPDPTMMSGSGLGLPLSRKLARSMGGNLTVHSRAGVGSIFELRLPLGPGEA